MNRKSLTAVHVTIGRAVFAIALGMFVLSLTGCGEDAQKPYTGPASGLPYTPTPPPPNPMAVISTDAGDVTVELFEDDAPNTVANFINLAEKGFYNGLTFHRIIKGFMIQGGDPKGDGSGGPGYKFPDEIEGNPNDFKHYTLAMANSGPDTNGSQFFIVTAPNGTPHLRRNMRANPPVNGHTIFGAVTKGQDIVDKLENSPVVGERPNTPVKIKSITITQKRKHEYKVEGTVPDAPPAPATPPATNDKKTDEKKPDEKKADEKKTDPKPEEKKPADKKTEGK
jgi:cyclophilin family peptidyl-prolyl cis-trans isomerase